MAKNDINFLLGGIAFSVLLIVLYYSFSGFVIHPNSTDNAIDTQNVINPNIIKSLSENVKGGAGSVKGEVNSSTKEKPIVPGIPSGEKNLSNPLVSIEGTTLIGTCANLTIPNEIYVLSQNIVGNQSNSNCIDIQANNITLNCDVYNITGNTTGSKGVFSNSSYTTITGCNMSNYTYGIYLSSSQNNSVTGCYIFNNSYIGVHAYNISKSNFTNNLFLLNNFSFGVASNFNSNLLEGNVLNSSRTTAFYSFDSVGGSNNTIFNNTFGSNTVLGIFMSGLGYTNVSYNNFLYNTQYGLSVDQFSGNYNNISNNLFDSNGDYSLRIASDGNTIVNNTIKNTRFTGIGFYIFLTSSLNLVKDNYIGFNAQDGVIIDDAFNTFINNNITSNGVNGITVRSSNNYFDNNTILNSTKSDITSKTGTSNNTFSRLTLNSTYLNLTLFGGINVSVYKGTNPPDPTAYTNLSKYLNITNNSAGAWIFVNFTYNNSDIPPQGVNFPTASVWKYSSGQWFNSSFVGSTNGIDVPAKVIYANITNFSSMYAPLIGFDVDSDGDGFNTSVDCNDSDNLTHPLVNDTLLSLDHNLTICNGIYNNSRIIIAGNNIKLNCNNSLLNGTYTNRGIEVDYNFTTVKNCRVSNYQHGIYVYNSNNNTLTNNTATSNTAYGIYLWQVLKSSVINNSANLNSNGIRLDIAPNNTITNNNASSNSQYGIYVNSGSNYCKIANNTANLNYDGIHIKSASSSNINNNTVNSNTNSGIYVELSSNNNNITSNNVSSNLQLGVYINASSNNTVANNNVSNNSYIGIFLELSNNSNVTQNIVYENKGDNVYIYKSLFTNVSKNNLSRVLEYDGTPYSLFIDTSSNTTIFFNNISNSNGRGIYLDSSNFTNFSYNSVTNNSEDGLYFYNPIAAQLISNNITNNSNGLDAKGVRISVSFPSTQPATYMINNNISYNDIDIMLGSNSAKQGFIGTNTLLGRNNISFNTNVSNEDTVTLMGVDASLVTVPDQYRSMGYFVDVSSDGPSVALNFSYTNQDLVNYGILYENTLKIYRNSSGIWNSSIGNFNSVDTVNKRVYANISNFGSIFAPLALNLPTIIPVLNSTTGHNYTTDNITTYVNVSGGNISGNISLIHSWQVNDAPYANLIMPFDLNNSSLVKDYSGYLNNGKVNDATWKSNCLVGGCYSFDKVNDYINISNSASLNITKDLTVELWLRNTSTFGTRAGLISKWDISSANGYRISCVSGGSCTFEIARQFDDPAVSIPASLVYTSNWHQLVGTYNFVNGVQSFYLDGELYSSNSIGSDEILPTVSSGLDIGRYYFFPASAYYYFGGDIDGVRVYNRSLSAEQVHQRYVEDLGKLNDSMIVSQELTNGGVWQDNVTLIDSQNEVVNASNNITIMQDPNTCRTILSSGVYSLSEDAHQTADNYCFRIESDNVLLDCQGHTIFGGGSVKTAGIYVDGYNNFTIKNCVIQDYRGGNWPGAGVYAKDISNSQITNCTFYNNNNNIVLEDDSISSINNTIYANKITVNSGDWGEGIYAYNQEKLNLSDNTIICEEITDSTYGFEIYPDNYSNWTMKNNNASGCGYSYFILYNSNQFSPYLDIDSSNTVDEKPIYFWTNIFNSPSGTCTNDTVPSNAGMVYLINCNNVTLQDANLSSSLGYSVYLYKTNNSKVISSNISNYGGYAIYLEESNESYVSDSNVNSTDSNAIYIYGNNSNIIRNNLSSDTSNALYIASSNLNDVYYNNFKGYTGAYLYQSDYNNISNNHFDNDQYGLQLYYYSQFNNIINNNISSNNSNAVYFYYNSSNNLFVNNIAHSELSDDVYSVASQWEVPSLNNTFINLTLNNTNVSFTYGGALYMNGSSIQDPLPVDKFDIARSVDITDGGFTNSWVALNFSYNNTDITNIAENSLKIYRNSSGEWSTDIHENCSSDWKGNCAGFDGDMDSCTSTPGCGWYAVVPCDGWIDCSSFNNNQSQCQTIGCTWNDPNCEGGSIQGCPTLGDDHNLCSQYFSYGCYWQDACMGVVDCGYYNNDASGCTASGCDWNTNEINGVDTLHNVVYAKIFKFGSLFAPLGDEAETGILDFCNNITSPGTYVVDDDLFDNQSDGHCINIKSDDVLLNCSGHFINGSNLAGTIGIYSQGHNNISVINCNINNYYEGARFLSATNLTVLDSNLSSNDYADIDCDHVTTGKIDGNIIMNSYQSIRLDLSSDVNVTNNKILNVTQYGVSAVAGSSDNIISKNNISGTLYGIYLSSSDGNNVSYNNVSNVYTDGISLSYSTLNNISYNNISSNLTGYGIRISDYSYNDSIYKNTISTLNRGIYIYNSNNTNVSSNKIMNTSVFAIFTEHANYSYIHANNLSDASQGMYLIYSDYMNFSNNEISKTSDFAVVNLYSHDINFFFNKIYSCSYGIGLQDTYNNFLYGDTIQSTGIEFTSQDATGSARNVTIGKSLNFDFNSISIKNSSKPVVLAPYISLEPYLDIKNVSVDGWIVINTSYNASLVPAFVEGNLKFYRNSSGNWSADVGTPNGVDTVNKKVYANISKFGSVFAPMVYANVAPTVASASVQPSNPTNSSSLTCNNGTTSDLNGDSITLIYDWFKSGAAQGINSKVLHSGNVTVGDKWSCSITPFDGYDNGSTVYSGNVTVRPPSTVSPPTTVGSGGGNQEDIILGEGISRSTCVPNKEDVMYSGFLRNGTTYTLTLDYCLNMDLNQLTTKKDTNGAVITISKLDATNIAQLPKINGYLFEAYNIEDDKALTSSQIDSAVYRFKVANDFIESVPTHRISIYHFDGTMWTKMEDTSLGPLDSGVVHLVSGGFGKYAVVGEPVSVWDLLGAIDKYYAGEYSFEQVVYWLGEYYRFI